MGLVNKAVVHGAAAGLVLVLAAAAARAAMEPVSQPMEAPQARWERVIHLYPSSSTKVQVKVFTPRGMAKSEPAYGQGWQVQAAPGGRLTNLADGRTYPRLTLQGGTAPVPNPSRLGEVLPATEVRAYFEKTLDQLGLSPDEIAEFVNSWQPRLMGAAYYRIWFLAPESADAFSPLDIQPRPDTVIRVAFQAEPLGAPEMGVAQTFPPKPERRGFTAVEYGGLYMK